MANKATIMNWAICFVLVIFAPMVIIYILVTHALPAYCKALSERLKGKPFWANSKTEETDA